MATTTNPKKRRHSWDNVFSLKRLQVSSSHDDPQPIVELPDSPSEKEEFTSVFLSEDVPSLLKRWMTVQQQTRLEVIAWFLTGLSMKQFKSEHYLKLLNVILRHAGLHDRQPFDAEISMYLNMLFIAVDESDRRNRNVFLFFEEKDRVDEKQDIVTVEYDPYVDTIHKLLFMCIPRITVNPEKYIWALIRLNWSKALEHIFVENKVLVARIACPEILRHSLFFANAYAFETFAGTQGGVPCKQLLEDDDDFFNAIVRGDDRITGTCLLYKKLPLDIASKKWQEYGPHLTESTRKLIGFYTVVAETPKPPTTLEIIKLREQPTSGEICKGCKRDFVCVRVAPCFHHICAPCAILILGNSKGDEIRCPECREKAEQFY